MNSDRVKLNVLLHCLALHFAVYLKIIKTVSPFNEDWMSSLTFKAQTENPFRTVKPKEVIRKPFCTSYYSVRLGIFLFESNLLLLPTYNIRYCKNGERKNYRQCKFNDRYLVMINFISLGQRHHDKYLNSSVVC